MGVVHFWYLLMQRRDETETGCAIYNCTARVSVTGKISRGGGKKAVPYRIAIIYIGM
jgi:hypothetical protein